MDHYLRAKHRFSSPQSQAFGELRAGPLSPNWSVLSNYVLKQLFHCPVVRTGTLTVFCVICPSAVTTVAYHVDILLSLSLSLSLCLSLCVAVSRSVSMSLSLCLCLSPSLSLPLSFCLSPSLPVLSLSLYLSLYLSLSFIALSIFLLFTYCCSLLTEVLS